MIGAIVTTACCCGTVVPNFLYVANKCVNYSQQPCVRACGNCCEGENPPPQIRFCDWYLKRIGFTLPFSALNCYFVEYEGCTYLINQTPEGLCGSTPPAGVYNEGTFKEVRLKGANPCCPSSPPAGACVPDIVVEGFPWSDPWGIKNPVTVSSTLGMCVLKPGTDVDLCYRANEFMAAEYQLKNVDTTQQVGKCFERGNPDTSGSTCSAVGTNYLQKIVTIEETEDFEPCNCTGSPGLAHYFRQFYKCYAGANDCAESRCPGFCPEGDPSADASYQFCVNNRHDCRQDPDPRETFDLETYYKLITAYVNYPCSGEECECAYYSDDAIRISFPLCYAIQAGLDPTDPADETAIKDLYKGKVEAFNPCDNVCLVNVGDQFGGIQPVTCVKICGVNGYKVQVFSGGAGDIAAKINGKMSPEITASSLNQHFWFGYRQNTSACGGSPNQRPPYGPGDLLEVDRAVITTSRCYVFLKGYSSRFRFCARQVVTPSFGLTGVSAVAICMSTNAVSPAEWAAGLRPSMAAVRTDCFYNPADCPSTFRCEFPTPATVTDCTAAGTYPQENQLAGSVFTPGYTATFGDPCGSNWLDSACKLYACAETIGCTCAQCESGECPPRCCECGPSPFGGAPSGPSDPNCIAHTLKCSVPSNSLLSIS